MDHEMQRDLASEIYMYVKNWHRVLITTVEFDNTSLAYLGSTYSVKFVEIRRASSSIFNLYSLRVLSRNIVT